MNAAAARRFRIAFYLPHLHIGGAETVFVRLARGLAARGHDVSFVLDRREGALLGVVACPVHVLDASRTLAALPRLTQWLRDHRPDVLMSAITPNNVVAILARRWAHVPTAVIVGEHSLLRRQLAKNWKFRLLPPLIRWLYPQADTVIAVSEAGRRDVESLMGADAGIVHVLPNPVVDDEIDLRCKAPVAHPWLQSPLETPVFLAAGRLDPVKDFSVLIDAFAIVAATRPCRLIILGEGTERSVLVARCSSLGLSGQIDLAGAVPDPLPWFARASAVVSSSRYEGFGLVLVEAMACGTPVVTTYAGGPPAELVGNVGPVAPSGDAKSLAAGMISVLDHPASPIVLKERARPYSFAAAVDAYEGAIERALAAR